MEFVQIILQNSNLKEAKLFVAAQKAALNPEIGVTIQNKAAFYVIRDCAAITVSYLPHLVFGSYQNPFESLKGKFKKEHIAEFVKQSETDVACNQLLYTIIDKAKKLKVLSDSENPTTTHKFDLIEHTTDPYGEYGHDKPIVDPNSILTTPFDILCKIFSV